MNKTSLLSFINSVFKEKHSSNARSSIVFTLSGIVIEVMLAQPWNDSSPISVTLLGIQILCKDLQDLKV